MENSPPKASVTRSGQDEGKSILKESESGKLKESQTDETDKVSKPIGYSGLCLKCKQMIGTNNYIKIGDRVWHGDHFECSICNKNLASIGFFEDKDRILCKECFGDIVSPKCGECGKPCIEKYVTASARSYHIECFTCKNCHAELNGKPFNLHNSHPHCMDCISNILSIKCFKCDKPILPNNEYVESMNKQYHSSCFRCSICSADLSGQGKYYIKEGNPCCSHHK
uniref:PDZ and LIM domain protein Zasp (Trinotate prediction) n=1 Tax=Myxobolus squamalis TaxID=59785 RepID=A0A6B2G3A0_MYXSQ